MLEGRRKLVFPSSTEPQREDWSNESECILRRWKDVRNDSIIGHMLVPCPIWIVILASSPCSVGAAADENRSLPSRKMISNDMNVPPSQSPGLPMSRTGSVPDFVQCSPSGDVACPILHAVLPLVVPLPRYHMWNPSSSFRTHGPACDCSSQLPFGPSGRAGCGSFVHLIPSSDVAMWA